jgi:uncharacterized membrane protein YkvA (DUF1232 family)
MVASWLLLIVLARRLPPGAAKDLAGFLPDCVTTARALRRDSRVPRRAKIAVVVALLWVLSPIDLIPEFLPVIGPLDDVIVVALLLRYAARSVPRQVVLDAWPGDPRMIERLLGPPRLREHERQHDRRAEQRERTQEIRADGYRPDDDPPEAQPGERHHHRRGTEDCRRNDERESE